MDQGRSLFAVVALFIVMGGTVALALDPLGPPRAGLTPGQFHIGGDLLYGRTDLDVDGSTAIWNQSQLDENPEPLEQSRSENSSTRREGQSINKLYANLGYGITRNWETFLRLGGADAGTQSDIDFAVGGGTKVTFYESGKWSFGGIAQLSWSGSREENESQADFMDDDFQVSYYASQSSEYETTEIQATLGVCYQAHPRLRLYGGPLVHFVDGTSESRSYSVQTNIESTHTTVTKTSYDIDETSCFGGYLGAGLQIHENTLASFEYQHTGGADAFAMTLVHRFGKSQ